MMKKVLYGIFAITALAATSVSAAPVQVGEAAGSAATSVSAGSSSATSVSTVGRRVSGNRRRRWFQYRNHDHHDHQYPVVSVRLTITTLRCGYFAPLEKRREATRTYPDLPAITGVFGHY